MFDVPKVRFAEPADYPQIISMAEELHAENGHSSIDYPTAEAAIMQAINRDKSMIGLVGDVGAIRGIVMLRFANFWCSKDVFLDELLLYVHPDYRKTAVAKALINFAKETADTLKLPLMIGVMSSERTQTKLRLYQRHLGHPVGGYFYVYPPKAMRF